MRPVSFGGYSGWRKNPWRQCEGTTAFVFIEGDCQVQYYPQQSTVTLTDCVFDGSGAWYKGKTEWNS